MNGVLYADVHSLVDAPGQGFLVGLERPVVGHLPLVVGLTLAQVGLVSPHLQGGQVSQLAIDPACVADPLILVFNPPFGSRDSCRLGQDHDRRNAQRQL